MISIFAKRAFLNIHAGEDFEHKGESPSKGHLLRVSSIIRADQIAERIGAKLNPKKGYKKGICIYVKPHVKADTLDFEFEGKKAYLDIVDGWGLIPLLEKHPEIPVIACSKQDFEILDRILKNKIVLIPQHHCNFERVKRTREGIKTIGIIGTEDAFTHLPEELEEELQKRGIKLLKYSKFFRREDIVDFYKQIDLQLVWRPYRMRLSNPLKIVNAASFGIPTIAFDESVFQEVKGCYIGVQNAANLLSAIELLVEDKILYKILSDDCLDISESYHIDHIGELYKEL